MLGKINATRARRRLLLAGACTAGIVTLGILPSLWELLPSRVQDVADISCSQVLDQIDGYFADTLDSDLKARIAQHLGRCSHCREVYRQHTDRSSLPQASGPRFPVFESVASR